ncbi:ubinuclein-1-like [Phycodurus eques]|uniref:ubinuclein-1-like n=1 Tax=Phycodurus eques TaxID=693459 RepID=UPI002ACE9083|nr:ubinuclein-1-like [Phycodurus eques]
MAQSRRVQLTSFPCDLQPCAVNRTVLAPKSPPESGCASGPTAAADCCGSGSGSGSGRLVVALFEPDDRNFTEFSYTQLLENKKRNKCDEVQPMLGFELEEQREKVHMIDLARKLEEKYAVKKKKDRIQDLIDIGYGYDDEDSFIDNSEAYDEFVPSSITTKYGGFYINTGVLHFRQASDTETDDETTEERVRETSKKRKRKDRQEMPKKKRSEKLPHDKNIIDAKSRVASELGEGEELMMKKKKKKKVAGTLSVTSMLKKFRREKELERQKTEQMAATPPTPVTPLCPADAGGGGGSGLGDPLLSLIGSTNDHALLQAASTVEFDIDLDCLLDVSDEISSPKSTPQSLMEAPPPNQPRTEHHHLSGASCDTTQPPSRKMVHPQTPHSESVPSLQSTVLPEGLRPPLEESIKRLMLATKTAEGESKLKFFTPEINSVLLDVECQCREHGSQLRSRVYTHLSSFLPCSKETLLKRVKKLKLAESLSNVEDPVQKLKEAIGRAMPEQITCFNQHCQEYEQVKTLRTLEDGSDVRQGCQGNNVEEKGVRRGGPKKLFQWNDEIREVLCHLLREKLALFRSRKEGNQHLEDYLKALLVKDIKPLWPKGWMQSRVLLSESRKILGLQLTLPTKRSRTEKKQLSIVAPSVLDQNTGLLPLKVEPPHETDSLVEVSSGSYVTAAETEVIVLDSDSSSPPSDKPLAILTDQTLAPLRPQELLAAAVAKYKSSLHNWSLANDSPPPPPPPPQCSPVNFPEAGLCHRVLPKLLQDLMGTPLDFGPDIQID